MALTITSNLTEITDGDTITNWEVENIASGYGVDADQNIQGNGCIAGQTKAAGIARLYYNLGSGNTQNLTSVLLRVWARFTELSKYENVDDMGMAIYVEDSSANWGEWAIGGTGSIVDEAWNNYVIETSIPFHNTSATSPNLSVIQKVGISTNMSTKPVRAANMFVDAIRYGPGLTITGTNAKAGQGFSEIADEDGDSTNKYGVFARGKDIGYVLTGNLVFGDSAGTGSVNFSDNTNAKIIFRENRRVNTDGTVPSSDCDYGSSLDSAIGFKLVGNSTGTTDFELGSLIGTGYDRQGILGGVLTSPRDNFIFDAETDTANIDSCNLYGVLFEGAGSVKLSGATTQEAIGCTFIDCEEIQPNTAEFLNNKIIAPTPRGLELVSSTNATHVACIAAGTGNFPVDTAWRYKSGSSTYPYQDKGPEFNTGTGFDTMGLTDAIGDYMGFGYRNPFGRLTVNVNSLQTRSGGTLQWQYWNGSTWSALDILVDETDYWANGGFGDTTWVIPDDWAADRFQREEPMYHIRLVQLAVVSVGAQLLSGGSIGEIVETHVHAPSTGNYTLNEYTFYGHPSAPGYPQWHLENSSAATTENSYTTANQDTTQNLGDGTTNGVAQSFTTGGSSNTLTSVSFYLSTTNNPTGNAVAKLYAHSGTLGTSSIPTGNALATSNTLNVEDRHLTEDLRLINFEFEDGIALSASTNYVLALEYDDGNTGNYINVGRDTSSPTHGGNVSTLASGTWTANSSADAIFYAYTDAKLNISAYGGNPSTKWNSNNSPGATKITQTVSISVRAYDTSNSANLSGVRVYLKADAGGDLTEGTTILDPASQTTNAAGLVVDDFNFTSNQPVIGWARQGSSSPYHKEAPLSGTITSAGLSLTAPMVRDE